VIGAIDLTYSRYHQGAESPLTPRDNRPQTKPAPPNEPGESPDGIREMAEITERLNRKAEHHEDGIRFQMEHQRGKRPPQIVMFAGPEDRVLGRYGAADIIDLERSIFDMAGFRFSIEG